MASTASFHVFLNGFLTDSSLGLQFNLAQNVQSSIQV